MAGHSKSGEPNIIQGINMGKADDTFKKLKRKPWNQLDLSDCTDSKSIRQRLKDEGWTFEEWEKEYDKYVETQGDSISNVRLMLQVIRIKMDLP